MKNTFVVWFASAVIVAGAGIAGVMSFPATTQADFGTPGTCSNCGSGYDYGNSGGSTHLPPVVEQAPNASCSLKISDTEVEYGGSVTLTWGTKNSKSATLSGWGTVPKNEAPDYWFNPNVSRTDTNLTKDKTYTLTVKGENGKNVTCKKTVKVKQTPKAPECTIALSKYEVDYKGSVTVTWTSKNADTVTLNGDSVSKTGSKTFTNLTSDKTFTIKSKSGSKEVTCVKTVEVDSDHSSDAPECDISLSRYDIEEGDDVTVYWTTDNADVVKLNGSTVGKNSSKTFYNIQSDKTFKIEVWNSDDEKVTCTEEVTVDEDDYHDEDLWCSLDASKTSVRPGESVRINWESENADEGYINNGIGSIDEDDLEDGSETVNIYRTTTFTGTFSNDDEDDDTRCSVTVYADEVPYITLSSVPYTGLDMSPEMAALYWAFIAVWCLVAAYLIAVKKVHYAIARNLKGFLFGTEASVVAMSAGNHTVAHDAHEDAHGHGAHGHEDETDEFILSQIHRK